MRNHSDWLTFNHWYSMNHWVFRIQDDRFYTHFFPIIFKIAQFNVQKWTIDYGSFYSSMMDIMDMMTYVPYDMKKSMRNWAPGWLLKFETFFSIFAHYQTNVGFPFPNTALYLWNSFGRPDAVFCLLLAALNALHLFVGKLIWMEKRNFHLSINILSPGN